MLAPMTKIDLPSCIGFLVPAFSHLHRDTVRLRVPERLRTLCCTRKIYITKKMNRLTEGVSLHHDKTVHLFLYVYYL